MRTKNESFPDMFFFFFIAWAVSHVRDGYNLGRIMFRGAQRCQEHQPLPAAPGLDFDFCPPISSIFRTVQCLAVGSLNGIPLNHFRRTARKKFRDRIEYLRSVDASSSYPKVPALSTSQQDLFFSSIELKSSTHFTECN